ncbi:hypothetical protein C2E23DRAFT_738427 [Lenzites betulinus]|nr:hypothetical protein C2E23DRAFT_738427 [Lenzites betulinus]
MNVFVLGGSKNIGYYAAVRLLEQGSSVTFLLRKTSVFDTDEKIQSYISSGKARLVSGDALNIEDVQKGWEAALGLGNGSIDVVLSSIGSIPDFSFTKGLVLPIPDLCTRSLLNLFRTLPASLRAPAAQPRIIAVTSRGITHAAHKTLPAPLRAFYTYALASAHEDKYGAERVLAHCLGERWTEVEPKEAILPSGWKTLPGFPAEGEYKRILVMRPALLTDGVCKGDESNNGKPPYKAVAGEIKGGYTISRRDIAHFIVQEALQNWSKWEGKGAVVVY